MEYSKQRAKGLIDDDILEELLKENNQLKLKLEKDLAEEKEIN